MIVLNGSGCDAAPGVTVRELLARAGVQEPTRGVAVAVDGQVVPRREWESFAVADGARVEVLTAMQGG